MNREYLQNTKTDNRQGSIILKSCFSNLCDQGYLGSVEAGKEYDATELVKKYKGPTPNILIDQVAGLKLENYFSRRIDMSCPF